MLNRVTTGNNYPTIKILFFFTFDFCVVIDCEIFMRTSHNYLAIDLGAESGRTIVGSFDGDRISLCETHRFANEPVRLPDGLHWDMFRLWSEIKTGMRASSAQFEKQLDSVGVDTWGVDFSLLDAEGGMLIAPFHYRDERTDGMLAEAFKRMPRIEIFSRTGIQFMQFNTLYQLLAISLRKPALLDAAQRFVTIPDLLNYWLCGEITNEFTNATTTQCFDPLRREWSAELLSSMHIPERLFSQVTYPGTGIGVLRSPVAEETGAEEIQVVLPACHDTGSAVVAVPAQNTDFVWISSGTWSIIGAEVNQPLLDKKALDYNFTNEGGVFNTWRLSKNIMGLWLIQECRRVWARAGTELTYAEMTRLASEAEPFLAVIDPDFEGFLAPANMPTRICQFCKDTNQPVPQTQGQILRVALESLALKYRFTLDRLEELVGKPLNPIHIVGGGTKNRLLNQFIADATDRLVMSGPVEATAIGNILMQAVGLNHIASLVEARYIVRKNFVPEIFEPQHAAEWEEPYDRFRKVINLCYR